MSSKKKKEKKENIPGVEFDLQAMDTFFHAENWTKRPDKWSSWVDSVKENLSALQPEDFEKVKWKTQANLQYCEQHSENPAMKTGAFLSSILSAVLSFVQPFSSDKLNASPLFTIWIMYFAITFSSIFLFGEVLVIKRRKKTIYYRTLLNIIESIEEKAKAEDKSK